MALDLIVTLIAGFLFVALVAGLATSAALTATSPERRRLRQLAGAGGPSGVFAGNNLELVQTIDARLKMLPGIPKSPKEMGRLRRRLATAGYTSSTALIVFSLTRLVSPVVFGLAALTFFGLVNGWILGIIGAAIGYLIPGLVLGRMTEKRKQEIRNGLPDALDLFIVCVEAGCGLDQAIVKASDELGLTHPALAYELRLITTEIRAGKPRMEAFKNFAARTKVDDVQSLVAMLVQTDKFGTSVAQALRIHAETSRTKRRQAAEERAAKVGVKLVFPLVLFLFPALYIVILGPAVISFVRVFRDIAH
jgi:tight adherence protein C